MFENTENYCHENIVAAKFHVIFINGKLAMSTRVPFRVIRSLNILRYFDYMTAPVHTDDRPYSRAFESKNRAQCRTVNKKLYVCWFDLLATTATDTDWYRHCNAHLQQPLVGIPDMPTFFTEQNIQMKQSPFLNIY